MVRRAARASCSTLLLAAAILCLSALLDSAPALAADTHEYLFQLDEVPSEGPAHEEVTLAGGLSGRVEQMTVAAGHLWVAENAVGGSQPGFRVDELSATTGAFISQMAHSAYYSPEYRGVAVGQLEGQPRVYLAEYQEGANSVGVYTEAGAKQASWNGSGTPAGSFGLLDGLAVDDSTSLSDWAVGDVYVPDGEHHVVDIVEPQAGGGEKYVAQLTGRAPGEPFSDPTRVAVDGVTGDVLVVDGDEIDVFEPTVFGQYAFLRTITPPPGVISLEGIDANDGLDDVYAVGREAEGRSKVLELSLAGAYLGAIATPPTSGRIDVLPTGVAADPETHGVFTYGDNVTGSVTGQPEGFIYAFGPNVVVPDVTSEPAASVQAHSATLNGTVDPDEAGEASCRFAWGTTPALGSVEPCEPRVVANGDAPVPVHAVLDGLQPDTTYYYRVQATNQADGATNLGEAFQTRTFTTPGPGVPSESVSDVTADSSTLEAVLDPHGLATSYYFQYGSGAVSENTIPTAPGIALGETEDDQRVSIHLQGLAAGVTYRYRVVVVAEVGGELVSVEGPEQSFRTQATGAETALPDGRQWEMVTPPDKQGAGLDALGDEEGSPIQAAADGGAITYIATAPFVANPAGSRSLEVTQIFSSRNAPGVWDTADIATPYHEGASSLTLGNGGEYKLFSNDLSLGVVAPNGYTPLPPLPAGSEKTIYLRTADGQYKALVTSANIPPGTRLDPEGEPDAFTLRFVSANSDLSDIILESGVPLTALPGDTGGIYEWSAGRLQKIGVLPGGKLVEGELGEGSNNVDVRNAVSADGSRVVWTERQGAALYMRDMTRGETIQLDAAQGAPETAPDSTYQTASSSDSRVFFTSPERLTADSTAPNNKGSREEDLYVFETTSGAGQPLAGRLTDLSVAGSGETAGVLGVLGASEDGSYIYFVAHGVLGDAGAHHATPGANLYVEHYEAEAGRWAPPVFVAALSGDDFRSWGAEAEDELSKGRGLNVMTSRVSPNGRYVAFMSQASLTGYDNRDANSGAPDQEVFIYDALTAKLACASCDPTGARPVGVLGESSYHRLVDFGGLWRSRWFAADIPAWDTQLLNNGLYQPRYLSDSGRLLFNSSDALVPADVNGQEDVYEYEPSGVGGCQGENHGQSASVVFSESAGGCVGLISSGSSTEESAFMDASETAGDIFFMTSSQLASQDHDTSYDVYDAHECTGAQPCAASPPLPPPPCATGDACKPSPTPQPAIFGAPSSETFSGAGNIVATPPPPHAVTSRSSSAKKQLAAALRTCRRRHRSHSRARRKCESRARRKHTAKSSAARTVQAPQERTLKAQEER